MIHGRKCIGSVGVPCGQSLVHTSFAWSFAKFIQFNERHLLGPGEDLRYLDTASTYRYYARNELAARAEGEWLLQLDSDHTFEPDLLKRLLLPFEQYALDVVTGVYVQRQSPYLPVLYKFRAEGDYHCEFLSGFPDDTLFQVECAGAGCLLVRTSVFERMRAELGEEPFDQYMGTGEDFSFFLRCKKLGIPVWVVPWVQCGHLGQAAYTMQNHKPYLQQMTTREEHVAAIRPTQPDGG